MGWEGLDHGVEEGFGGPVGCDDVHGQSGGAGLVRSAGADAGDPGAGVEGESRRATSRATLPLVTSTTSGTGSVGIGSSPVLTVRYATTSSTSMPRARRPSTSVGAARSERGCRTSRASAGSARTSPAAEWSSGTRSTVHPTERAARAVASPTAARRSPDGRPGMRSARTRTVVALVTTSQSSLARPSPVPSRCDDSPRAGRRGSTMSEPDASRFRNSGTGEGRPAASRATIRSRGPASSGGASVTSGTMRGSSPRARAAAATRAPHAPPRGTTTTGRCPVVSSRVVSVVIVALLGRGGGRVGRSLGAGGVEAGADGVLGVVLGRVGPGGASTGRPARRRRSRGGSAATRSATARASSRRSCADPSSTAAWDAVRYSEPSGR